MLVHEIILLLLLSVVSTHKYRPIWQNSHGDEWLRESCDWLRLGTKRKRSRHIEVIKSFTSWLQEADVEFAVVLIGDHKDIAFMVLLNHIDFHKLTSELVVEHLLEG